MAKKDVEIKIQFNSRYLTIPVNPEQISISSNANNNDIDIIGLGKATTKGDPGLESLSIESFFPGPNSYFYKGTTPKSCVTFIKDIWKTENKNNNVGKITITGLPIELNMYFVIDNFTYDHRAGEEEDIYFKLEIKKYVPYGVIKVPRSTKNTSSTSSKARASSTSKSSSKSNVYVVKKGDCLWSISKACSGNGNNWKKLYDLNKKIIGKNPNLIKPGQKLTLPSGWKVPVTTKKTTSTKKKTTTTKKKTTVKKTIKKTVSKVKWSSDNSKAKNRTTGKTLNGFWANASKSKAGRR